MTVLVRCAVRWSQFDAAMEYLGATLIELNVPDSLIGEAAAIALSEKKNVLNP